MSTGTNQSAGHPEDFCEKCGRPNIVWFAPSALWNKYAGDEYGILCPICFVQQAEEAGYVKAWELSPEDLDAVDTAVQAEREAILSMTRRMATATGLSEIWSLHEWIKARNVKTK